MRIPIEQDGNEVDVPMSPLIDCVFLLLIFFLVTNMMKKSEMQIPLSLPPITSSLSTKQSTPNGVIIAVDEKNRVYQVLNHDTYSGHQDFVRIKDLNSYLNRLKSRKGQDVTIDIAAYRTVPIKSVIAIFDKCQLQGFAQTRVRLGSKPTR